jgi:hypothetical protein
MGLNNLENKIREDKLFFDEEPSADHLLKFKEKLDFLAEPENKKNIFSFPIRRMMAIAASAGLILFVSIFSLNEYRTNKENTSQLSKELLHVKMYYSTLSDEKMEEINRCVSHSNENELLLESTKNRLLKLDENTQVLEEKLNYAQGNKQLENAYIQSLMAKSEVTNQIYEQLCTENTKTLITY